MTDDTSIDRAAAILDRIPGASLRSHPAGEVMVALVARHPVYTLDTGSAGEDDVLIGTRGECEADVLAHHDLTVWPEGWTLTLLVCADTMTYDDRVKASTGHDLAEIPWSDDQGDMLFPIVATSDSEVTVAYGYAPGGDEGARTAADYRRVRR